MVGLRNWASLDVSKSRGDKPKTVVKVVNNTGRNLSQMASKIAGFKPRFWEYSSIVETKTMESFMIIPVIPISPTTENRDKFIPQK